MTLKDNDHYRPAKGVNLRDNLYPESAVPGSETSNISRLLESCTLDDPSDAQGDPPEHDIEETIASIESQVDHLCSLLDNFRSDFTTKFNAFRDYIKDLPDHVNVAYNSRQRAYLLRMYSKSITQVGDRALQTLQDDLQHLAVLGPDARLYTSYASTESLPSMHQPSRRNSTNLTDSTPSITGDKTSLSSSLRQVADLLHQRASASSQHLDAIDTHFKQTLPHRDSSPPDSLLCLHDAQASPRRDMSPTNAVCDSDGELLQHLGLSRPESGSDSDNEHTLDSGDAQHPLTEAPSKVASPRRELIIDNLRCGGNGRDADLVCSRCLDWERRFEEDEYE